MHYLLYKGGPEGRLVRMRCDMYIIDIIHQGCHEYLSRLKAEVRRVKVTLALGTVVNAIWPPPTWAKLQHVTEIHVYKVQSE